jgi:2-oxoisovalerate dehydrogenase E1 component
MISHLGPQLGVADGIALANKLKKNGKLPQFSPVKVLPVKEIFMAYCFGLGIACYVCIENNGYGLSTPTNEQYRCET